MKVFINTFSEYIHIYLGVYF